MSDETQAERTPGPDTSAEAVERLAENAENLSAAGRAAETGCAVKPWLLEAHAATLRALLAERDAARNEAHVTRTMIEARGTNRDYWQARAQEAEAERDAAASDRDALRAENERMRVEVLRGGVIAGLGVAAVLAADAAQAARADAARRFLRTSKARDLGAADALARLCDQIGKEIQRRG